MTVAMTWAQYKRHECSIDGVPYRLRAREADILLVLLLGNPAHFISKDHLIEAIWPNPDLEPDCAEMSYMHVYMRRLRKIGIVIENRHRNRARIGADDYGGWRIPAWARGRPERVQLAA